MDGQSFHLGPYVCGEQGEEVCQRPPGGDSRQYRVGQTRHRYHRRVVEEVVLAPSPRQWYS